MHLCNELSDGISENKNIEDHIGGNCTNRTWYQIKQQRDHLQQLLQTPDLHHDLSTFCTSRLIKSPHTCLRDYL